MCFFYVGSGSRSRSRILFSGQSRIQSPKKLTRLHNCDTKLLEKMQKLSTYKSIWILWSVSNSDYERMIYLWPNDDHWWSGPNSEPSGLAGQLLENWENRQPKKHIINVPSYIIFVSPLSSEINYWYVSLIRLIFTFLNVSFLNFFSGHQTQKIFYKKKLGKYEFLPINCHDF